MPAWFTSDLHFGHGNILTYSKRPFESIEEHDEMLVIYWNAHVQPSDQVYCLGDFALCDVERATRIAKRLTGQKFLVFGNHDKRLRKHEPFVSHWQWCKDLADITVEGQRIVLSHYAMLTWNQSHRGAWNLHGHSHGSLRDDPNALRLDVGVDCWGYCPVSFPELKKTMARKTWHPIDHHGRSDED